MSLSEIQDYIESNPQFERALMIIVADYRYSLRKELPIYLTKSKSEQYTNDFIDACYAIGIHGAYTDLEYLSIVAVNELYFGNYKFIPEYSPMTPFDETQKDYDNQ